MPEIVDIIHRITYDVQDQELVNATNEVQKTISKISQLTNQLTAYENKLKQTARTEISERKAIQAQIERVKNAINQQNKALENQIVSNKKLQSEISKEIGLIGRLNSQLETLKQKRDISNDISKIKQYNREIAATQSQLNTLTSGGGRGGGIGSSILQGLGLGVGVGLITQGISELQEFISLSSRLAAETEGVKVAFDRLNNPALLKDLREATRGTVSDLELMKSAVQFNNFGLPVQKLATALEFARIRAKETGQSVDFLVQSITTGIGRQSPLILDNLGINAKRVRDEFQKTGNFAEAAFKIIQEESAKAGNDLTTFAEKQAQINAQIANAQAGFGKFFNEVKGGAFVLFEGLVSPFQGQGLLNLKLYLDALKGINDEATKRGGLLSTLSRELPRKKITAQNATLADIGNLTKEELDELKTSIDNARNALSAGDKEQIERYNKLDAAIKKYTDTITGSAIKKGETERTRQAKEYAKALKELEEQIKETLLQMRKLTFDAPDVNELGFNAGLQNINPAETKDKRSGVIPSPDFMTDAEAARLEIEKDIRDKNKKDKKEQEEFLKNAIDKEVGYYQDAANSIIQTFQNITDARISLLDFELQVTQTRIEAATELAKRGNTEVLDAELENLNRLQDEREKATNKQLALNTLLQASGAALAAVQALQTITNAGTTGDPYTIPIRIAAAISALAAGGAFVVGLAQAAKGFKGGGYTGNAGTSETAGVVHGQEFVITAEKTKKYRPLLDAIHNGTIEHQMPINNYYASKSEMKGVESKLDILIELTGMDKTEVKNMVSGGDLVTVTNKHKVREQNRRRRG